MLDIGRRKFRNLPEQVGFLTGEVEKIWEALDGLDVYDNVIILDNLDPLSENELEIVNKPVSFIVYNNTLYMKRGVGVDEVYFDAVFQVTESGGIISFNSSEITVSYPLGTLAISNTSTNTYTKDKVDTLLSAKLNISDLLDAIYPVGAIYISTVSTSPASLFGGTWTQKENRFLLGAGSGYTAGTTGGEATHTLTINEMPTHSHKERSNYGSSSGYYYRILGDMGANNASQTLELLTENAGNGAPHNNMPPYVVVYMWERTA